MKRCSEHAEKNSEFSGKLKSKTRFDKLKDEDFYSYSDMEGFEKKRHLFDSGELRMSISRELKPSTPARTGENKVWRDAMNVELRALESTGTWSMVSLPPNKYSVGCK